MMFEDNSNGSSNYLLKNRRIVPAYLAIITHRKFLIILILTVCISFALFELNSNRKTQNEGIQSVKQSPPQSAEKYKNSFHPLQKNEDGDSPTAEKPLFRKQDVVFMEDYEFPARQETMETTNTFSNNDGITNLPSSELYPDDIVSDSTDATSYSKSSVTASEEPIDEYFKNSVTTSEESTDEYSKISVITPEESNDESLKVVNPIKDNNQPIDLITTKTLEYFKPPKSPRLVIDTHGCKIPKLDPWDSSVASLLQILDPFVCCGPPQLMYSNIDGSISLNETVLLIHYDRRPYHISCTYQPVYREHEFPNYPFETGYSAGNMSKLEFGVPLNEEFVGTHCDLSGKVYYQYFAFPHLKKEVEKKRNARTPPEHRLNVILLGIDSVSKLNFLRHFSRTRTFFKEKMHPFSMKGYVKVGDNTFPNLVPMLTGHTVEHYYNESMAQTYFFDDIDLIWKDYAKRGYRTFFAEDAPYKSTFNYLKRGFYNPPTDYYLRTLLLAMENAPNKEYTHPYCVNSQLETDFIYKYMRDFVKVMDTRPYIAFTMVSKITHDIPNHASYMDEPTVHLLEDLWDSGALNNSVLFLFSNHGVRYGELRYTYIGKFEEKMPFMYVYFPQWFLDQHPELAKNLATNQERIMTLFDVHATMLHLLDLELDMTSPKARSATDGLSLLQEIPSNRTCEKAHIQQHYCPCQNYEPIPNGDFMAIRASRAIVADINAQLQPFNESCAHLELDTVLDARVNEAEKELDAFNNSYIPHKNYLITLVTKPGQAMFDGTVRHDLFTEAFDVLGISRINMYRDQSKCIDSQKMKIFCFCNT